MRFNIKKKLQMQNIVQLDLVQSFCTQLKPIKLAGHGISNSLPTSSFYRN